MSKIQNYDKEMDKIIEEICREGRTPTLLLHSCCAPCSSATLERLANVFKITIFYYNPNIEPAKEFDKRFLEQERFIGEINTKYPIKLIRGRYNPEEFHSAIKGKEHIREGGERCYSCYELRLRETAKTAKSGGFDYFTTTLSISPYKNAKWLNEIGERLSKESNVPFLYADLKKKNGYKRSIELSKEYNLYRQNYCGCEYSKKERDA